MRSWAGNEDPCENPLLTHRRFGLTGPPVHVDFNNPGRLGNRLFQAAHAANDPNPNPNSRAEASVHACHVPPTVKSASPIAQTLTLSHPYP